MKEKTKWFYNWSILMKKDIPFSFTKGIHSFVNPYSMWILKESTLIAEEINYLYIDSFLLRWFVKKQNLKRLSFDETSLAPKVFRYAKDNKLTIAIIGTKEELIHKAIKNIENRHSIKIDYYRNGYFSSMCERDNTIKEIIKRNIDIVICGMGTPYQELFLIKLKWQGWLGYGFTCGGYLHQIAKKENYYPLLIDRMNLRWLYRLIDEPKLIKRYIIYYCFFYTFIQMKRKK